MLGFGRGVVIDVVRILFGGGQASCFHCRGLPGALIWGGWAIK